MRSEPEQAGVAEEAVVEDLADAAAVVPQQETPAPERQSRLREVAADVAAGVVDAEARAPCLPVSTRFA